MAESLHDGEFWLPPQFLTDDDIFMDKKNNTLANNFSFKNGRDVFPSETDYSKPLFPLDFPYGVGSFGVSSDLSSPVESVVGSTEESDEEDYIAGLTCQMARSTLEDDFRGNDVTFGNESTKVLYIWSWIDGSLVFILLCYFFFRVLIWGFFVDFFYFAGLGCIWLTTIHSMWGWKWVWM